VYLRKLYCLMHSVQSKVINHWCFPVFTVNTIYMSTTKVIYLYSTVVLLAPFKFIVVEKAIYEAIIIVKQSYSECYFSAIFIESK